MMNTQTQSNILVREATADDAAAVVRLIRQLGSAAEVDAAYVSVYLAGTQGGILLAQGEGEVQGLLSYSVRPDLFHAGNSVLIEELVVEQGCRGKGIGGVLLDALMEKLQGSGCKEVCLAVMPDNIEAIRFYKQHGLVEEALFLERHF